MVKQLLLFDSATDPATGLDGHGLGLSSACNIYCIQSWAEFTAYLHQNGSTPGCIAIHSSDLWVIKRNHRQGAQELAQLLMLNKIAAPVVFFTGGGQVPQEYVKTLLEAQYPGKLCAYDDLAEFQVVMQAYGATGDLSVFINNTETTLQADAQAQESATITFFATLQRLKLHLENMSEAQFKAEFEILEKTATSYWPGWYEPICLFLRQQYEQGIITGEFDSIQTTLDFLLAQAADVACHVELQELFQGMADEAVRDGAEPMLAILQYTLADPSDEALKLLRQFIGPICNAKWWEQITGVIENKVKQNPEMATMTVRMLESLQAIGALAEDFTDEQWDDRMKITDMAQTLSTRLQDFTGYWTQIKQDREQLRFLLNSYSTEK